MAKVVLQSGVFDDFDRFIQHMIDHGVENPTDRITEIKMGLRILSHSPLIGRPMGNGRRELLIGQGARGYLALYRYVRSIDTALIMAMRHQREAFYRRDN